MITVEDRGFDMAAAERAKVFALFDRAALTVVNLRDIAVVHDATARLPDGANGKG